MSFKKKTISQSVTKAKVRYSGMEKIDTDKGKVVNYGSDEHPLTKAEIKQQITDVESAITLYNQALEQADKLSNQIDAAEALLDESISSVLKGAAGKFTQDGDEIETLGGTRKSDRKPPKRKAKKPA